MLECLFGQFLGVDTLVFLSPTFSSYLVNVVVDCPYENVDTYDMFVWCLRFDGTEMGLILSTFFLAPLKIHSLFIHSSKNTFYKDLKALFDSQ